MVPTWIQTIARRSIAGDRRGTALIEFALLLPVLILILGGLCSIGLCLRAEMTLHAHARDVARGVSLGYMTAGDAKRIAEERTSRDLNVRAVAAIDPATRGDPNDQDVRVTLTISPDDMAKVTPFAGFVTGGLSARVEMRSIAE